MTTEQSFKTNVGLVLLAAGKSSRLGQPKQLLHFGDNSLLKHSYQIANSSVVHPVIIVLGAHADSVRKEMDLADINVVVNEKWEEGMASSIRRGVETLVGMDPNAEAVIIMVCDQPFVTPGLLNNLVLVHQQSKKPIVVCSYKNTYGPPVLFHKSMFPELLKLKGDVGARGLVQHRLEEVEMIPFPDGYIDIDTEADYENLQSRE